MGSSAASTNDGDSASAGGTDATGTGTPDTAGEQPGIVETVRRKTGNLQAGLADLLDSSARSIRQRGATVGDAAGGAIGDAAAERLTQSGEAAASVLEHGAIWLRENDLSDVEARVKGQLEQHPTRTLLVAAGVGFLLSRRRS
jgi:hypothetical protein